MINLAESPDSDEHIIEELTLAGVNIVRLEKRTEGEVATTVKGQLGEFIFSRAWYYWVVSGLIPLSVAQEMYAHPRGVKDIRVNGHCGCPPPEKWVVFCDDEGVLLAPKAQLNEHQPGSKLHKLLTADESTRWVEDPTKGIAFINLYHIDSQSGFNFFVDTLKKHGLVPTNN